MIFHHQKKRGNPYGEDNKYRLITCTLNLSVVYFFERLTDDGLGYPKPLGMVKPNGINQKIKLKWNQKLNNSGQK